MNNNYFSYLGYKISTKYDENDKIFYGKIEDIDDTVCFYGKTIDEFLDSFMVAVNDYNRFSVSRKFIELLRFDQDFDPYAYFFGSRACGKNKLSFTHYGHNKFNKKDFYTYNEWTLEENIFSNFWGFTKSSNEDVHIVSDGENSFNFTISNNARVLIVYLESTKEAADNHKKFLKLANIDAIRKRYDAILFKSSSFYDITPDDRNSILILNPDIIKVI